MTSHSLDLADQLELVAHRVEFIDLLDTEGPLEPRDIVETLDHSRSTVTRALRTLREVGLIEQTAEGYTATLAGVLAAEQYHRYKTASEAILTSKELLKPIPRSDAPPVDLLINANTIHAEDDIPVRPLEAVSARVRDADTVAVYLPTLVNTHLLRVWHRAVLAHEIDSTAIFDPDLLTVLKGQYPHLLAEMAAAADFSAFATDGPPYGLFLTTTGDTTTVAVVIYEDDTAVRGVVINESSPAVEWGCDELERLEHEAADVTADLAALTAAVTDGMPDLVGAGAGQHPPSRGDRAAAAAGHALPLDLEAEGFVRLSPEYFDTHSQAAPDVSWRTGFTLAEVQAGHPVARINDEGRNLTEALLEQLQGGADRVVLGSPGSGKSTVCMQVACEWYEQGRGPVLYRERGGGDHFTSPPLLEAYLRQTDDHALVVVEDAVREEANAIFDVMQALADAPDVTFLLDARTHEWQGTDTRRDIPLDARRETYRRSAIDHLTVPALDEHECERFIEHFTDLVDIDLGLSGAELFAWVQEGTAAAGDDEVPAGEALIAQHYLTQWSDPAVAADAQPATALDEAARRTYQRLTDADVPFAPELAVLINLLTAVGIPVAEEYCYAIVAADEYTELEEAITLLKGQLLFEQDHPRTGSSMTYRTRHETWALHFLEQFYDLEPTQRARERFGQCVTQLLALADEPQTRQKIKQHLGGRTPHLHQIEADPGTWADETTARVFSIGQTNASLAPLFGETTAGTIALPDACSAWTEVHQAYWRGEMNRIYGDFERAEREFCTLDELAETIEIADATAFKHATSISDFTSIHEVVGEGESIETAQRTRWQARSRINLGLIAVERGELAAAEEYLEGGLALSREFGDRHSEARSLGLLGCVAWRRGKLEAAEEYLEESLTLSRELGDRRAEGIAFIFLHLGIVATLSGKEKAAKEHLEESLTRFRELDSRYGEAHALSCLGWALTVRGELDAAEEYLEKGLALARELGDRNGEALALSRLGWALTVRGELDAAEEYLEESLALAREVGDRHTEAYTLSHLGDVAREHGELETAVEHLDKSLVLFREVDDRNGEALALNNLGDVARERGERESARSRFAEAADRFVTIGAGMAPMALRNAIDVCEQQGDIDAALELCQNGIIFAEETDQPDLREEFSARHADLAKSSEA